MAWAKLTKWVDGENCIIRCNVSGILSNGVVLPRRLRMIKTGSTKSANSNIELTCAAIIIILKEMIEERYIATPPAKTNRQSTRQARLLRLILDPPDLR